MPTPFDTPATVPQPSLGQNIMGMLGVTWGKDQSVANQDAARLEEARKEKQQAYVWGPLYKKAGEVASANPEWGADKVMLDIVKSPEWLAATSTPGFDHTNAGKNLLELVRSTRPTPPTLTPIPKEGGIMASPGAGSANPDDHKLVATGGSTTKDANRANEVYRETTTPAQVNPQGITPGQGPGKLGEAQATAGQPVEQPTPGTPSQPTAGLPYKYEAPDGSDADSPVMPYKFSVRDVPPTPISSGGVQASLPQVIDESAFQYGINPDWWASQVWKESKWKPNAVGPVLKDGDRAYGLAQIKGSTWKKEIAPELGFAPMDINDPVKNLIGGAYYMSKLLRKYEGDYTKAAMAYNWGQGNFDLWDGDWSKVPDETIDYVLDITNGGVNVPQGLGGRGPNVRTKRAIINALPDDRPATVDEVNDLVRDRKEFMFLGSGFVPWFKNAISNVGRQVDPTLAKGDDTAWMQLDLTNQANLKNLRYNLSKLNRSGDQRLAVLANAAMDMFPEGAMTDPLTSVTYAIELYRNLSKEYHANEKLTVANTSEQVVKEAIADNERIMQVLRAMPSLIQMTDMQKLIREGIGVQSPGGAIKDITSAAGRVMDYATRDLKGYNAPKVNSAPGGLTNTTAPVAGQQGGPQIKNVTRGPDGKLRIE